MEPRVVGTSDLVEVFFFLLLFSYYSYKISKIAQIDKMIIQGVST